MRRGESTHIVRADIDLAVGPTGAWRKSCHVLNFRQNKTVAGAANWWHRMQRGVGGGGNGCVHRRSDMIYSSLVI